MTKKIVFLSMDDMAGFVSDDDLTIEAFAKKDIAVETLSWRANCNWSQFDAVVLRSTWDYQAAYDEFLIALNAIDESQALLLNPLDVVKWNIDKRYLAKLEQDGVPIVPTTWLDQFSLEPVYQTARELQTDQLVIKPTISANADNTFRVSASDSNKDSDLANELGKVFAGRTAMVQPFVESVLTDGEYSLFVIDNVMTHAVIKKPASGDYRVQEEHGGSITEFSPGLELKKFAGAVIDQLDFDVLYARIDVVMYLGQPVVMEIELIEPSLYFRFSDAAIEKFVSGVVRRLERAS